MELAAYAGLNAGLEHSVDNCSRGVWPGFRTDITMLHDNLLYTAYFFLNFFLFSSSGSVRCVCRMNQFTVNQVSYVTPWSLPCKANKAQVQITDFRRFIFLCSITGITLSHANKIHRRVPHFELILSVNFLYEIILIIYLSISKRFFTFDIT